MMAAKIIITDHEPGMNPTAEELSKVILQSFHPPGIPKITKRVIGKGHHDFKLRTGKTPMREFAP